MNYAKLDEQPSDVWIYIENRIAMQTIKLSLSLSARVYFENEFVIASEAAAYIYRCLWIWFNINMIPETGWEQEHSAKGQNEYDAQWFN